MSDNNKPQQPHNDSTFHWSQLKERGSMFGIEVLVFIYKVFGKWLFKVVLTPVMFYFYITGRLSRHAIWHYLDNLNTSMGGQKRVGLARFKQGFKLYFSFGMAILDKFDAWLGKVNIKDIEIATPDGYQELVQAKGAVIFSAHLGNMEICRAIFSMGDNKRPLNVITYNEHTPSFNNFLKKVNKEAAINFIHINNFGPDDTIKLKQKIDDGEAVVIFADRTSVNNPTSVHQAPFLGEQAPFAVGPFALANIMECPVFLMFCINEHGRYRTYIEKFADPIKVKRKERQAHFQAMATKFAERLEFYCKKAPYQWYNFFNFWQKASDKDSKPS
ncbi:family 2 glycosyl transferase [Pseudoalteromonas sp. 2CM28B]|uniref:LpxL/LpxP family acyltransferase n=2 Tax=Bacteria TaxID=2 RepID=UPI0020BFE895|nr:family 2 glycosyl transferase [Pseudoalteromonas sp. 2CM28B]MCK8133444.1 family 2 glycosyl transferase [Pseudoalteromonas sp. 2CM28B]